MTAWASGKHAKALCDECGRTIFYLDLRKNVAAQRPTGLLVCEECNDKDHPQLMLGRFKINDPIALQNPRPDWPHTQGLAGYKPVTGLSIAFRTGGAFAAPSRDAPTVAENIGFAVVGPAISIKFRVGEVAIEPS